MAFPGIDRHDAIDRFGSYPRAGFEPTNYLSLLLWEFGQISIELARDLVEVPDGIDRIYYVRSADVTIDLIATS